jgi:iron-sulfur cluster assembly accessory protein
MDGLCFQPQSLPGGGMSAKRSSRKSPESHYFEPPDFPGGRRWYNLVNGSCEKPREHWSEKIAMAVILTERAAQEVKRVLEEQKYEPATLLRVGITGGGCSGFQYSLGFDKTYDAKVDSKYDYHGVSVVVDKKSALFLDGTTVDFYDGLEKRGFTFENPNAQKTCGCGHSFQA